MASSSWVCVSVRATAIVAVLGPVVAAQRPIERLQPVTVVTRESLEAVPSVLFDLPNRRIDQVVAELPSNTPLTARHVPDGWSVSQRGRDLRLSGPAADGVTLRLEAGPGTLKDWPGREVRLRTGTGNRLGDWERLQIGALPPAQQTANIDGILTIPPQASPRTPLMIGVVNDYRRGTWTLHTDGGSMPLIAPDQLSGIEVIRGRFPLEYADAVGGVVNVLTQRPGPQPFVTVFPDSGFSRVTYTDPFGERTVDAPLSIVPVPPLVCPRSIRSASALTFAGQPACVSGCFPDVTSAFGLMLDGTTELAPWGIAPTTVMLGIPEGTAPGEHTITIPGTSSSATIRVVTMEGSLDQTKLWRGESTTMRLRVLGTTESFPLTVINRAPSIIDLEGGVYQALNTPGGLDNAITRSVRGIQRGNFSIFYSVNAPGCGAPAGN